MELTNLIKAAWENGRDFAHDCKSSAEDAADYINFLSDWEDGIKELSVRLENADTGEKQCNLPVVSGSALDVAKQIPQVLQTQMALNNQLKILRIAANKLGLYDAADFIKRD